MTYEYVAPFLLLHCESHLTDCMRFLSVGLPLLCRHILHFVVHFFPLHSSTGLLLLLLGSFLADFSLL